MKFTLIVLGVCLIIGVSASIEDDLNFSENELEFLNEDSLIETYGLLDKIQCKLCVEVMRPVAKALRKDSAKREIVNALDRACTIIPIRKYRSKCRNSVKKHGEEIANKIGENVDAKKICDFLEFC